MNKYLQTYFSLCAALMMAMTTLSACRSLEVSGGALELSRPEILSRNWPAQLVGVTDGDTIKVRLQGQGEQVKIRLYGIDAPEKGQPFGRKSTEFLMSLSLIGAAFTVEPVNFDRYGRLVAIVYGSDGRCLNAAMVEAGLAWVYPQYCKKETFCENLFSLFERAQIDGAGLWSAEESIPPWEWRKMKRASRSK